MPVKSSLGPLPTPAELADLWRDLEARAEVSFFLSWSWIGCWLGSLPATVQPRLLRAERAGRVVGLAIVVESPIRRLPLPWGRAAHVHATGLPEFDVIAIEHNGFLVEADSAPAVQKAMLEHLCAPGQGWREVHLPGLSRPLPAGQGLLPEGTVLRGLDRDCWWVDLGQVRGCEGGYLGLLSAKRRAHIRRSMRAFETLGPLQIEQAQDTGQALDHLDRLIELHRRRWDGRDRASCFDTAYSREFHRSLVREGMPRGEVQLLRVRAGPHDVGLLYNFIHRGVTYFYQSGFDYSLTDAQYSPGLVTLALAIEHNARLGQRSYDFLAGDAQYKRSLGTHCEPMQWATLHRTGLAYGVETALRGAVRTGRRQWRSWQARRRGELVLSLLMSLMPVGDAAWLDAWAAAGQGAATLAQERHLPSLARRA